jgi:hypothetical protein
LKLFTNKENIMN